MKTRSHVIALLPFLKRFERWVSVSATGCWLWSRWNTHDGYPKIGLNGKIYRLHRLAFSELKGDIPNGLVLDHICRNRDCFNPDHLEAVTVKQNIRRGLTGMNNKDKTHCPRGHEYNEENTYIDMRHGWIMRKCRVCDKEGHAKRRLLRR